MTTAVRCAAFGILALGRLALGRPFTPTTVEWEALSADGKSSSFDLASVFETAFTQSGMLAVTGIPKFSDLRLAALQAAHSCIVRSPEAVSSTYADGTVRRTLAASSSAFARADIQHGSTADACRALDEASASFREAAGLAANLFATRLDQALDLGAGPPLLQRSTNGHYANLEEAVAAGQRLEHFHTYRMTEEQTNLRLSPTIEFHVDQGLFIAFVPALLLDEAEELVEATRSPGTFTLKSRTGEELEAELPPGSMVFLAGDALAQILGRRTGSFPVHAAPHAVQMPRGAAGLHRVWYGMMQLPPADALSEEAGVTYGKIRQQVVASSRELGGGAWALGCSRKLQARELEEACGENQLYCWHRCMDAPDASPEICEAQGLKFDCVDIFDQIYRAEFDGHGDYFPACTNATEFVTPRPVVEQPSPACGSFTDLVEDTYYAHRATLVEGETYFLWNLQSDTLEGKMIHNAYVGWLALGIENIGGARNGMNGAPVIWGGNFVGQNFTTVGEYMIHPSESAWRHWQEPLNISALEDASLTFTECYSEMTFRTATIYGIALNVTEGTNRLIWALSTLAYPTTEYGGYAPYHTGPPGSDRTKFRGHITLDFSPEASTSTPEESRASACSWPSLAMGLPLLFMAYNQGLK